MVSFTTAQGVNNSYSPSYKPTAVFVGGTSGIGEAMAGAFAHLMKGNVHIIILGRSDYSAKLQHLFPAGDASYEFIQCDISILMNVKSASENIKARLDTLNYLVLSSGLVNAKGFTPTEDGIDESLSVNFYSRWKFVDEFMPCFEKAIDQGQDARVMTVLAPGGNAPLLRNDLGLKNNYSFATSQSQSGTYNDIMVEEYSHRYPKMSFIHIYPGLTDTGILRNMPTAVQAVAKPVMAVASNARETTAEYLLYPLLSPEFKTGAWHLDNKAEPYGASVLPMTTEDRFALVDHYQEQTAI